MARKKLALADRFWSKVDRSGECWEWLGCKDSRGNYGHISVDGTPKRAHRVAWFLTHGDWPAEGLVVCHSCDNPRCVRPAHLFAGTQGDNLRDMRRKGRHAVNKGGGQRGEQCARAVLTEAVVRAMLRDQASGMRCIDIARRWGIDPSHCRKVLKRHIWKHVSAETEVA